jgi:hypothetical protein
LNHPHDPLQALAATGTCQLLRPSGIAWRLGTQVSVLGGLCISGWLPSAARPEVIQAASMFLVQPVIGLGTECQDPHGPEQLVSLKIDSLNHTLVRGQPDILNANHHAQL